MEVIAVDKAVSTEDLGVVTRDIHQEVARLEAMLNTLVENKVESMKADKEKEKNSKQRITSTSTTASSEYGAQGRRHRHHHHGRHHHRHESSPRRHRKEQTTIECCEHEEMIAPQTIYTAPAEDEEEELMDEAYDFMTYEGRDNSCVCSCPCPCPCTCNCPTACQDNHREMQLPFDEDFISITMPLDYNPNMMADETTTLQDDDEVMIRRARRKRRRRRRKRRRRQRLAAAAALTAVTAPRREPRKSEMDDLPQRARWTIVATACLLLLMCLLLVGVTLRMAPIIDDMVRKENEELMNSLNRDSSSWNSTATTTAAPAVAAIGAGK